MSSAPPLREPVVLALDAGTSSVRAMLFDARGGPVPGSQTRVGYAPRIAGDGTAEVDFDLVEGRLYEAIEGALARAGAAEVAAVGFSAFWHGLVGLGEEGRPTTPVLLWSDSRSWRHAERLRRELDAESVRVRTGCPIHPSYWPSKLAWLREADPATFARTRLWVSPADLFYLRLFGELGTGASMASGTGVRRLAGGWDGELLERLAVRAEQLPTEVAEMSGLAPEQARRWPRLARAVWLCAAGDGGLANLGSGCVDPSQRALTVGTSGALRVVTDRRPEALARGLWCYLLEPARYVVGGSLSNGGNLYAWMLDTLRLDESGLEERIARMGPATTGLTFLPLLAGERSPGFAPHATGAIAGLTQATSALDIARAGLEAVALTFAAVDRALDATVPGARRLVASGAGLLHSPAWMQIMADATGRPVLARPGAEEASSYGAAAQAFARLGVRWTPLLGAGRTFEPREAARTAYEAALQRLERLYATLIEGSA